MSGMISFPWINDGKEFELMDLPISGHKAVLEIKRKQAKSIAEYTKALQLHRCNVIVIVKKTLDKRGVSAAKKLWSEAIPSMFGEDQRELMEWDEKDFESNLNAWYEKEVLPEYDGKDIEEIHLKIKREAEAINVDSIIQASTDMNFSIFVTDLYWRIRWLFESVRYPDGKEAILTTQAIEDLVRWPEDYERYSKAIADGRRSKIEDILKVDTPESVSKK